MRLINALIGLAVLVYVVATSFAIGVTGSQEQHLNLFGVSGYFWFFFLLFVNARGSNMFSGLFGLSEVREYSHTEISISGTIGTARNIFLSARDIRAQSINALVGLSSIGLLIYTAIYFPNRPNLQASWENDLYKQILSGIEVTANGLLVLWGVIEAIFMRIFG